jgi:hypothetical protein
MMATSFASAQLSPGARSREGAWTTITTEQLTTLRAVGAEERVWPVRSHAVVLDPASLGEALAGAPREYSEEARSRALPQITLPMPDGGFEEFTVVESPVYEDGLYERMVDLGWPQKTYRVVGVDHPSYSGRIDFGGPAGFFAMVSGEGRTFYVDPKWMGDDTLHVSFWRADYPRRKDQATWQCLTEEAGFSAEEAEELMHAHDDGSTQRGGFDLRTYRFACAGTGEYTAFHGGTVAAGQAAITTMTNRINQVYERDFAVRLILVANNTSIVYDNASTDPYSGQDVGTMVDGGQLRSDLTSKIGTANFDVGHGVTRNTDANNNNGLAGAIGNVCQTAASAHKAEGASSLFTPTGDAFAIDYVAHELGHQFGGRHPFASCGGGPGEDNVVVYEPGSGSTIMAYAGICFSTENLQSNSDAMFHIMNIIQINTYIAGLGGSCIAPITTANNNAPTISAGPDHTIPAGVPFELTATNIGDGDGDTPLIAWEQIDADDTSPVAPANAPTSAVGPVYRSRLPVVSPTRNFPPMANVIAGSTPPLGDRISTIARTFTFRASARDNNAEAGRVSFDDMVLTTVTGTTFAVTSPNGGENVVGSTTVTWNAGTTASPPINTPNVDIYLSTDGGQSFPTLVATVPNTGSAQVSFGSAASTTARVKIKGSGNVFFDISNANFTLTAATGPHFQSDGSPTIADNTGNGNGNGRIDPGETSISLTIPIINNGVSPATGVTANLASFTNSVSVPVGSSSYPDMNVGAGGSNAVSFVINVADNHPCGDPIDLRLNVTSAGGANSIDLSLPTGQLTTTNILTEGFEGALPGTWTAGTGWTIKTNAQSAATPHGGAQLISHEAPVASGIIRRLVTPPLSSPAELTFWHTYLTEQLDGSIAYDGLQLMASTDGGSSFSQIPNSLITQGAPVHTVSDECPPTGVSAGSPAWSGGNNAAMTRVTVDLSGYTGQTVRVAFQYFEDCGFTETNQGWSIDDVSVTGSSYTCDPPDTTTNEPPTVAISAPATDQTVSNATSTFGFAGTAGDSDGTVTGVQWRNNGGGWNTANGTTSWSFDATPLAEGANLIEVRAMDDGGDFSTIPSRTITREAPNTPPTVAFTTPAGPTDTIPYDQAGNYSFAGTASDPDGTVTAVQYRYAGGAYNAAQGTDSWSFSFPILSGENVIEVRAGDDDGDFSDPVSVTIIRAYPAQPDILSYLLGVTGSAIGLDTNRDGTVTVADLVFLVNQL